MKKSVCLLSFLLLSLNCYAGEIFPISTPNAIQIDGTVNCKGDKDYIYLKEKQKPLTTKDTIKKILKDPYIIKIDNNSYILIKDKKTNDWNAQDILGIDDTKNNLFQALRKLDSDGDLSKLTSNELKKAKIRFVKINNNGELSLTNRKDDYNLNNIDYIDMFSLRTTANSDLTGIFGHFNIYLKTNASSKQMVTGYVTITDNKDLKILFK